MSCVSSFSQSDQSLELVKPYLVVPSAPSDSSIVSDSHALSGLRSAAMHSIGASSRKRRPNQVPVVEPGKGPAILSDLFPQSDVDAAATGFALSHMARNGLPVLWVQDRLSHSQAGGPCLAGLDGLPMVRVQANRPVDVLWAMEEGLRAGSLGAVLGEIWGDPDQLDFTATKRLNVRAHASGVPVWMIRRGCAPNLSAARNRWRVASMPSSPHAHDPKSPGEAFWKVELFRSRELPVGHWVARYDRSAHRLHFSSLAGDRAMADPHETISYRATG